MANKYRRAVPAFENIRDALFTNVRGLKGSAFLTHYRQTLRIQNPQMTWGDWVRTRSSRDSYGIEERFKGWGSNSPFPAVPFVLLDGNDHVVEGALAVLVGTPRNGQADFVCFNALGDILEISFRLTHAVPVFINKIGGSNNLARDAATLCTKVQELYHTEVRDDLGASSNIYTNGDSTIDSVIKKSTISNETKLKENLNMKNTKADNFIQDQKDIAKEIASLNAGRVSNKVVKEAMRPLVALLFKPTFMQKLAMKLTGAKNPLDEFMNTPYADLLCAQLFKVAIDMRDIDNVHVKKTANSAVIYAGLKVTEQLPVEDLIDKAISQVAEATSKAIGKGE